MRFMSRTLLSISCFALALGAVTGCDDGDAATGEGDYRITVYGEPYIEEGIPAEEMEDGWAITFDKFLVAITEVRAADGLADVPETRVFDLAIPSGGEGHALATVTVPAATYSDFGYRIAPAGADAVAGNASPADVAALVAEGASLWVEGSATKAGQTVSFAWTFRSDTTYTGCETSASVVNGGSGTSQITIHSDHLFYDDLVSEEPFLRFDLIAGADADADGIVTKNELSQVDITGQERYQVGNRTDIVDLWTFMVAQTATLGHIDGEGHCDAG